MLTSESGALQRDEVLRDSLQSSPAVFGIAYSESATGLRQSGLSATRCGRHNLTTPIRSTVYLGPERNVALTPQNAGLRLLGLHSAPHGLICRY